LRASCDYALYLNCQRRKLKAAVNIVRGRNRVFGTIKKVVKDKGFGFIIADDGGDEVFFHRSALSPKVYFDDLREGNEVQFDVRPGEKGRQAFNLRLR
jgi:CspA family cold shock protein